MFAAIALLLTSVGAAGWGLAGLLVSTGAIGLVTASYALLTGRRTWALIPSRTVAAGALSACLVLTSFGAALAPSPGVDGPNVAASIDLRSAASRAAAPDAQISIAAAEVTPPVIAERKVVVSTTAVDLLATLTVKGKAPGTGYARTAGFGRAWLDVDRNGCDTRNDILARDLTADVMSGRCKVVRGTLADPYTGRTIHFVRGNKTSTLVQIDHVVALKNSWLTGAQKLTQLQRVAFANDPLNLVAVDGRTNAVKGARDAASWLPPKKSYRCDYVTRQIEVKAKYRLWVAPAERDAMARVLGGCPGQPASRQKPITIAP